MDYLAGTLPSIPCITRAASVVTIPRIEVIVGRVRLNRFEIEAVGYVHLHNPGAARSRPSRTMLPRRIDRSDAPIGEHRIQSHVCFLFGNELHPNIVVVMRPILHIQVDGHRE
jgi:hypothetical protein